MAVKVPKGWYDISVPLKQGMVYFPTDPAPPKIYRYSDRALGAKVTMSMLEIISHTGTHIDSPLHFIPDGSHYQRYAARRHHRPGAGYRHQRHGKHQSP